GRNVTGVQTCALPIYGTTFGGNPVCTSAALAVIDVLETEGLIDRVAEKGRVMARKLASLDNVDHVRGRGFMLGLVLDGPLAKGRSEARRVGEAGDRRW